MVTGDPFHRLIAMPRTPVPVPECVLAALERVTRTDQVRRVLDIELFGACVLLVGGLTFASRYVRSLEDRCIHALAPSQFDLKNQGTELQAAAFRQSDLLVVYGSSELEFDNPYHASPNVSGLSDGL